MGKDKYEISLWEDYHVLQEGNYIEDDTLTKARLKANSPRYYLKTIVSGEEVYTQCTSDSWKPYYINTGSVSKPVYIEDTTATKQKLVANPSNYYYYDSTSQRYIQYSASSSFESVTFYYYKLGSYIDERKVAIIGSDSMETNARAVEPKLVENINGTHTFTFKLFYTYTENDDLSTKLENPFTKIIANESKIKVYWKDDWYDFIVKNCQESTDGKSITYTCKDLYVNELSKTGFDLEFDNELENNQGTVHELGAKVLEGTDWTLESGDLIQQTTEEAVYEVTTTSGFDAKNDTKTRTGSTVTEPIPSGKKILVFYSCVRDQKSYCQFVYDPEQVYARENFSQLVTGYDCYSVEDVTWEEGTKGDPAVSVWIAKLNSTEIFYIEKAANVSSEYRGSRLVRQQESVLDPITDKYCSIYTATDDGTGYSEGDKIYEYSETEFQDSDYAINLIVNPNNFLNVSGWTGAENVTFYPTAKADFGDSYIKFTKDRWILNSALKESKTYLPETGVAVGEKYVLRIKGRKDNSGPSGAKLAVSDQGSIEINICQYTSSGDYYEPKEEGVSYFTVGTGSEETGYNKVYVAAEDWHEGNGYYTYELNPTTHLYEYVSQSEKSYSSSTVYYEIFNWLKYDLTCSTSFNLKEITGANPIGLLIKAKTELGCDLWLKDAEFFRYIVDSNGQRIDPNEYNADSKAQVFYKSYNHTTAVAAGADSIDDITLLHNSTSKISDSNLEPDYNKDFTKIRSISEKNSNRFNLLQTLAETFECWCTFRIDHDGNGRISRDSTTNVPKKYVKFVKDVGEETGIGFIYGIDLKAINRTIQSDQIVTKTIVVPNSNEYATNGFCTIARSEENYSKSNAIYDFGYFTNIDLIDGNLLNQDLYSSDTTSMGYYTNLHRLNSQYDENSTFLTEKKTELTKKEGYRELYGGEYQEGQTEASYGGYYESTKKEIENLKTEILQEIGSTNDYEDAKTEIEESTSSNVISKRRTLAQAQANLASYKNIIVTLDVSIESLQEEIEEKEAEQEALEEEINIVEDTFFKKYSRFIQEGSWTSEDYVDDTLYYLDALSTAYTSSRPQITYDISVVRMSAIEGFENKVFKVGDISYIQDPEFFGYDGLIPKKEKVLVSEITSNFDSPEKDVLTIQNYKTQFEDLFQRITSTTQSLQFSEGEYARAASTVNTDGTIKAETLQSSIALNSELVISSQNESIFQDNTGITLTDNSDVTAKVKITSKGIFITNDGGSTWQNAIRGNGVSTNSLSAGSINVNKITLTDGNNPTFRWDSQGINAFSRTIDETGTVKMDPNRFVRFDRFGVYGINNDAGFSPSTEQSIWDSAQFGMTWNGFFMKNNTSETLSGATVTRTVEVSSKNDFCITETTSTTSNDTTTSVIVERVKIGQLSTGVYGIRISDLNGSPILESSGDGSLWLKSKLKIGTRETKHEVCIGSGDLGYAETTDIEKDVSETYYYYDITDKNYYMETKAKFDDYAYHKTAISVTEEIFEEFKGQFYYKEIEGSLEVYILADAYDSEKADEYYIKTYKVYEQAKQIINSYDTFIVYEGGQMQASIGSIGGWNINNTYLESVDGSIKLDSKNNNIIAESIELGDKAVIANKIDIGSTTDNPVYLYNPTKNDNKVLQSGSVLLDNTGRLALGNLILDGAASTINGSNWRITNDYAEFNNVNVSGKIVSSIFEFGKTQAVGGAMIFKPTYKISPVGTEGNLDKVILEDNDTFVGEVGDYCYLFNDNIDASSWGDTGSIYACTIKAITTDENTQITTITLENFQGSLSSYTGLIVMGHNADSEQEKRASVVIGINSTENKSSGLFARGMTIGELSASTDNGSAYISTIKKVFLGDLNSLGIENITGYGLYADNVFLTGTLTTAYPSTITPSYCEYAGINTMNGIQANKFGTSDNSRIVMWAGSKDTSDGIKDALFQVTEKGSIYAKQALIEGDILSATIHAAAIYGNGTDPGLTFYDVDKGLTFKRSDDDDAYVEIFSIGEDGLTADGEKFVDIDKDTRDVSFKTSALTINGRSISSVNGLEIDGRLIYGEDKMIFEEAKNTSDTVIGYNLYMS